MSKKIIVLLSVVGSLLLVLVGFLYFKYFFSYSEGVNEGDINYFQKEGFIFKTYEGKMIQTGYSSKTGKSTIQSNEFKFSVEDEKVAKDLQMGSTQQVKLRWHRYLGTLPWRGKSQYIVDEVIRTSPHSSSRSDVLDIPMD